MIGMVTLPYALPTLMPVPSSGLGYNALWLDNTPRRLGELLVNGRRVITQRDLEYALTIQKRTRRKLGQILLALGKVSDRDLFWALDQQRSLRDPWGRS
jgi:hypothetical protein